MNFSDKIIANNLLNTERLIIQNYNIRPLPLQKGYNFIKGKFPILLSAPHAARTIKNEKIKIRENYVGSFVHNLSKACEVYGIYTINIINDPNHYLYSNYKNKIKKLINNRKIKFVLDIHGSDKYHKFDVDIGTYNHNSILGNKELVKILILSFKNYGFKKISENFFTKTHKDTITRFSYHLGIPSIQLEINKSNRYLRFEKENTLRMYKALFEAIKKIKEDFLEINNNV